MTGSATNSARWKAAAVLAAAAALFAAGRLLGLQEQLRAALDWIDGLGPWGPAIFVLLYAAAAVALVPGSILTIGAGAVFGLGWGTVWASLAATAGASAAFLVGRTAARDWARAQAARYPRFRAVEEAVSREGLKIVFLVRLSPAFPYNLLNYAFSLSTVRFRDFLLGSWAGMLPGTLMYVYIGSLAGDLATAGGGGRARTPAEWALYAVGLAATVAVTVTVTRLARAALAGRLEEEGS